MIFTVIGLAIIVYSIANFKKGFMLFLAFSLFLGKNITFFGIVPLSTLMSFYFFLLFIMLRYMRKKKDFSPKYPWRFPMIAISFSIIISSIYSISGFSSEISTMLGNIIKEVLVIWVMWNSIETEKDFKTVFKYVTVVMIISCLYGFIEYAFRHNFLYDYTITLANSGSVRDWRYAIGGRGYRVFSIFEHPAGAGMNWALYGGCLLYFITHKHKMTKNKPLYALLACFCIVLSFLTKMRSVMVFALLCMLAFWEPKKKRFYYAIPFLVIIIVLLLPTIISNPIFRSLFDDNAQSAVGGSSLGMRIIQLEGAFELFSLQPMTGLGTKYMNVLPYVQTYKVLGMETILVSIPVMYGIIGIVAYGIRIIYDIVLLPKRYDSRILFVFTSAFWLVSLITSTPGFSINLMFLISMGIIKTSDVYKKELSSRRVKKVNV